MKLAAWQAILLAYGVLLVATETEAAPLAVVMAWSIAAVDLYDTLANHSDVWKSLFSGYQAQSPQPPVVNIPAGQTPAPTAPPSEGGIVGGR